MPVYSPTPKNKKLGRVGQHYGSDFKEGENLLSPPRPTTVKGREELIVKLKEKILEAHRQGYTEAKLVFGKEGEKGRLTGKGRPQMERGPMSQSAKEAKKKKDDDMWTAHAKHIADHDASVIQDKKAHLKKKEEEEQKIRSKGKNIKLFSAGGLKEKTKPLVEDMEVMLTTETGDKKSISIVKRIKDDRVFHSSSEFRKRQGLPSLLDAQGPRKVMPEPRYGPNMEYTAKEWFGQGIGGGGHDADEVFTGFS